MGGCKSERPQKNWANVAQFRPAYCPLVCLVSGAAWSSTTSRGPEFNYFATRTAPSSTTPREHSRALRI